MGEKFNEHRGLLRLFVSTATRAYLTSMYGTLGGIVAYAVTMARERLVGRD